MNNTVDSGGGPVTSVKNGPVAAEGGELGQELGNTLEEGNWNWELPGGKMSMSINYKQGLVTKVEYDTFCDEAREAYDESLQVIVDALEEIKQRIIEYGK